MLTVNFKCKQGFTNKILLLLSVKKIVTILLLFLYLCTSTQLGQLFKIPAFIHHYKTHKQQNKNLSLFAFLKMHYANDNVIDDDYDDDMKLPFKTMIDNNCFFYTANVPTKELFSIKPIFFDEFSTIKHTNTSNKLLSSFIANIWQPPRLCVN